MSSNKAVLGVNKDNLIEFIKSNRVLAIAIAGMLSRYIGEMVNSFTDNIIVPVMFDDSDSDDDDEPDVPIKIVKKKTSNKESKTGHVKKMEKNCVKINGIRFKVGKFIVEFIKFAVMLVITIMILVYISMFDVI